MTCPGRVGRVQTGAGFPAASPRLLSVPHCPETLTHELREASVFWKLAGHVDPVGANDGSADGDRHSRSRREGGGRRELVLQRG